MSVSKIFRRILCLMFGHEYYVHQHFFAHSRRVKCKVCDGDWAMNDDVRAFVPWSKEFEEMYRSMGREPRCALISKR